MPKLDTLAHRLSGSKVIHNKIAPKGYQYEIFEIQIVIAGLIGGSDYECKVSPRNVDPDVAVYDVFDNDFIAKSICTDNPANVRQAFANTTSFLPDGYKTKYMVFWKSDTYNDWSIKVNYRLTKLSRKQALWEYLAKRH